MKSMKYILMNVDEKLSLCPKLSTTSIGQRSDSLNMNSFMMI